MKDDRPFKRSRGQVIKTTAGLVKKAIARMAEAKEITTTISENLYSASGSIATNTSVTLIDGVAEGTDEFQRIGKKVTHKQLEVSINIVQSGNQNTSTANPPAVWDAGFWAIVLDRQPNLALPGFGTIFDVSSGSLTYADAGLAMRLTTGYQDRFVIVAREEWSTTSPLGGGDPYHMKKFIDLAKILKGRDKTVNFSGTDATIGSINYGALYFVVAQSNPNVSGGTSAGDGTFVNANMKWNYTDM